MKITIDKLIYGGFGLGKAADGKIVFVPKSVPGDTVEVVPIAEKKSHTTAKITKIIDSSPHRTNPPCPFFDLCGSCDHQNIPYEHQLTLKNDIFREILLRQKIHLTPENIISTAAADSFQYRNSLRLFATKINGQVYFTRHTIEGYNSFVPINHCLLMTDYNNQLLAPILHVLNNHQNSTITLWQVRIREGIFTGESMVDFITIGSHLPEKDGLIKTLQQFPHVKSIYHTIATSKNLNHLSHKLLFGAPCIHEKVGKYIFRISPESFFQPNSRNIQTLYNVINNYAAPNQNDTLLDLYCGTGTIGIYLSNKVGKIIGIENSASAIKDAHYNAAINNISHASYHCGDVERILASKSFSADIVIIDPPRAGLTNKTILALSKINFQRIVYASCNPTTFARDVAKFREQNIHLTKVQPIDMFPHTHHIECVGLLEREGRTK
ncbi:MAG: 23S rRNA (uracil-C(5))-methyltransferase RlmCD [bacterium ADurb.Bin400]|nr:MAG: 23S rRNA (uracil-C(5))-methyltransferase RlmCD [bacterium ADurb.Bin400]